VLVLLTYLVTYLVLRNPPRGVFAQGASVEQLRRTLYPAEYLHTVVATTPTLGGAIALILGVLSMGSEYGWGTVKTMLTQRPGRLSVLAGKLLALAVALLVLAVLLLACGAASSAALAAIDGRAAAWPGALDTLKALGAAWLVMAVWTALGVLLAVLFRQSALAIGIGLVYMLVVEGLVFQLLGQAEGLRDVLKAFPGSNAASLAAAFPTQAARPAAAQRPVVDAGQATLVLAAYGLAFVAAAAALFRGRDVT
jgi:ABC-2 type transport system permease protein